MSMVAIQAKRAGVYFGLLMGGTLASFIVSLIVVAVAETLVPGAAADNVGLLLMAPWAIICGIAAWRRHMLAWACLCLGPIALFSLAWVSDLNAADRVFDLRWSYIMGFTVACLVTAATGILTFFAPDNAGAPISSDWKALS